MRLVLFDFDKTLTTKDSFIEFLKFATNKRSFYLKSLLLFPFIAAYKVNLYSGEKLKVKTLKTFFKGIKRDEFEELGKQFANHILPYILNKGMMEKLYLHQHNNDQIVIVSASPYLWLLPWTKNINIALICTNLAYNDDVFEGYLAGKNCKGKEKPRRIINNYQLSNYKEVICYGNKDDIPMLRLASSTKNRILV